MMTDLPVPLLVHDIFEAQAGRIDRFAGWKNTARIMVKARDTLGGLDGRNLQKGPPPSYEKIRAAIAK